MDVVWSKAVKGLAFAGREGGDDRGGEAKGEEYKTGRRSGED